MGETLATILLVRLFFRGGAKANTAKMKSLFEQACSGLKQNPPAASSLQTRAAQPRLVQTHTTLLRLRRRYEFICQVSGECVDASTGWHREKTFDEELKQHET